MSSSEDDTFRKLARHPLHEAHEYFRGRVFKSKQQVEEALQEWKYTAVELDTFIYDLGPEKWTLLPDHAHSKHWLTSRYS